MLAFPFSSGGGLPREGSSAGLLGDGTLSNQEWQPTSSSVSQNLVASHADSFVGEPPLMRQNLAASLSMNQRITDSKAGEQFRLPYYLRFLTL